MPYIKQAVLGLLFTVGTCTAYVTPASGHKFLVDKNEVKGTEVFVIKGNTEAEINGKFVSETTEILGKISGKKISIRCENGTMKDEIEKEGLTKGGELLLEKCNVSEIKEGKGTELTACIITSIPFKFKDTLLTGQGISVEIELRPSSGKLFAEFEVSGSSCAIKGKAKIETATEGKGQICVPASVAEIEQVVQFSACGPTGSKEMRLDGEKAGFIALWNMKIKTEGCEPSHKWSME